MDMKKKLLMDVNDVELLKKESSFSGYFKIDRYHLRHRQFSGGRGPEITREIFERGHAASVLMYDPHLDLLVFIEQFRPGAYAAIGCPWYDEDQSPWLIEIVAGIIEAGEDPAEVVRREAIEEAGCEVMELELISHYLVTPGASTESMFAYCGRVDASKVGGLYGLADEGEDIRVFTMSPGEAFDALESGRIQNSMTMIPVLWFRQNREKIRAKWSRGAR
tara:strand:+ start:711 stop:1370 length:660 start_codon:yes stop_codon:yes gene_type:complete